MQRYTQPQQIGHQSRRAFYLALHGQGRRGMIYWLLLVIPDLDIL